MNILQTSFMERFEKSLDKEAILSREIEAHEMLFDEALLPLPPDIHSTKRPIRELSYTDGAILQIREAYIKFIVNGTDIAEAGDLYSVNGEMKRRPPSDIQIHYYNEARERHSHLQWLKGLTKHELIISDMVIIAIFNKYKHHFRNETPESWMRRFDRAMAPLPPIDIEPAATEGSDRLVLIAILSAIQDTTGNAFNFNDHVKTHFGISAFGSARSRNQDKETFIETFKSCKAILRNDIK